MTLRQGDGAIELAAISMVDEDDGTTEQEVGSNQQQNSSENEPTMQSQEDRLRAALAKQQGLVVAPQAQAAPFGVDEEELCCGVCLDTPAPGQLATLWCCKNVLCIKDAQQIGACPFCREEPLVWELCLPSEVKPE